MHDRIPAGGSEPRWLVSQAARGGPQSGAAHRPDACWLSRHARPRAPSFPSHHVTDGGSSPRPPIAPSSPFANSRPDQADEHAAPGGDLNESLPDFSDRGLQVPPDLLRPTPSCRRTTVVTGAPCPPRTIPPGSDHWSVDPA